MQVNILKASKGEVSRVEKTLSWIIIANLRSVKPAAGLKAKGISSPQAIIVIPAGRQIKRRSHSTL
jgi:hypothetical protein